MVLEKGIAELLQGQAKKFIHGFNSEQLSLGILSGSVELKNLALNPEPFDELFMGSELPFMMKAGTLASAVLQLSIMQGELELTVDGLTLVLAPACKWLTRPEVHQHRTNEMERLEFVHMKSQSQRRTLEREMFRKLFSDYLSRIKIIVRNVHLRLEVEEETGPIARGLPSAFGFTINAFDIIPMPVAVPPETYAGKPEESRESEVLLGEQVKFKGFSLYHEPAGTADIHVPWHLYASCSSGDLGVFEQLPQAEFNRRLGTSRQRHASAPVHSQLMPPTDMSAKLELKSQSLFTDCHVEKCLTMEVVLRLEGPSRFRFSASMMEGVQWLVRRSVDFQMWPFLHAQNMKPTNASSRWHAIRSFVYLKRRIQSNVYSLQDSLMMRMNCKEYIRLFKRRFNGPESSVAWRKTLRPLSKEDAVMLTLIELSYPAEKLVNFRMMAQAEMKTESSLNSFADEGISPDGRGAPARSPRRLITSGWQARELTPLEQLHLHGQHGFGINIFRGLPPPPSNLKIRIDLVAPHGLWWVCNLDTTRGPSPTKSSNWAVALDCAKQPVRMLLVDSVADTSVFATVELPRAPQGERPLSILLARSEAAFQRGSPAARGGPRQAAAGFGGTGAEEWCSLLEVDGSMFCWAQVKTVQMSASHSPWDIFLHLSCGQIVDQRLRQNDQSFARISTFEEILGRSMRLPMPESNSSRSCESGACLRFRIPLSMTSSKEGPFTDFLRWCVAAEKGDGPSGPVGLRHSERSFVAWLAAAVSSANEIGALRAHVMLPPAVLEGGDTVMRLPRFDAACHLEHGGLMDGFVVGLHNLRQFSTLVAAMHSPSEASQEPSSKSSQRATSRGHSSSVAPLSLRALEQAPPLMLIVSAILAALAVVLAGGRQKTAGQAGAASPGGTRGPALLKLLQQHGLEGVASHAASSPKSSDSPLAAVTLWLTLLAVAAARRALWDQTLEGPPSHAAVPSPASSLLPEKLGVDEVFSFFSAALEVVVAMGFPLHTCCLPLAAWAGSVELLHAAVEAGDQRAASAGSKVGMPKDALTSRAGASNLMIWATRGAFSNPMLRQSEVMRWLLHRRADIEHRDSAGRSVLDWACWAGSEELVARLLRSGVSPGRTAPLQDAVQPLVMATASRSAKLVSMLLRASGDPHAVPRGDSSNGTHSYACGSLLLAVRCCEYELACEVLRSSAHISVDMALGAPGPPRKDRGGPAAKPDEALSTSGTAYATRATVVLVESLRRFAAGLGRRNAEEVGAAALRAHVPGPHPDEGLFATSQMPLGDILHPLVSQLPTPAHKVQLENRPGIPSLMWLRRRNGYEDPWAPARLMVECCLKRGFRPDESFLSKVTQALPPEVQVLTRRLLQGCSDAGGLSSGPDGHPPGPLPTLLSDIIPEIRQSMVPDKIGASSWWGSPSAVAEARVPSAEFHPGKSSIAREAGATQQGLAEASAAAYLDDGPWCFRQQPSEARPHESSSLPAVRVVVLGEPRVGKSSVARLLAETLGLPETATVQENGSPAYLRIAYGVWPSRMKPMAEVHIWDTSSALVPNLPVLATDLDSATVVISVVDASRPGFGEAVALAQDCENTDQRSASLRRALVVQNVFSDAAGLLDPEQPPASKHRVPTVRCNLLEESSSLKQAFSDLLADVTKKLDATSSSAAATDDEVLCGQQGDFRSALARDPLLPPRRKPLGTRRALAWRLQGDSRLVDPVAASRAWAAIWASRSILSSETSGLSGTSPSSSSSSSTAGNAACGGSGGPSAGGPLVSWERLETVLSSLGCSGASAAPTTLLGALAELGLLCPMPNLGERMSRTALIPDFARRQRMSTAAAQRLLLGTEEADPVFARLLWEGGKSRKPPSLRSTLRDFLAQGALEAPEAAARRLRLHCFALLEAGPSSGKGSEPTAGCPGGDLTPGFALAFDFIDSATAGSEPTEDSSAVPAGEDESGNLDALLMGSAMPGLTFVLLGVSPVRPGHEGFWDVLCTGPHAQWAWHALLGAGCGTGPVFQSLRTSQLQQPQPQQPKSGSSAVTDAAWPFPSPRLVISESDSGGCALSRLTGAELSSLAWLFCGPQCAAMRKELAAQEPGSAGFASCCAALCGKSPAPGAGLRSLVSFTGGLSCCGEFEACLVTHSWAEAPGLLSEALAAGAEAWQLCCAALRRFARDTAAAAAGQLGKALPLLQSASRGSGCDVHLLPEGPRPLLASAESQPAALCQLLAAQSESGGVQAWLRICRPAALWTAAGAARRYCPPHVSSNCTASTDVGIQVVSALQAAVSTPFTEALVAEVWQALDQAGAAQLIIQRPGGTWMQAGCDEDSLIL